MAESRAERRRRERAIAKAAEREIAAGKATYLAAYSEADATFAAKIRGLFGTGGGVGRASRIEEVYPGKIIKLPPGTDPKTFEIKLDPSEYGRRIEVEIRDDPFDLPSTEESGEGEEYGDDGYDGVDPELEEEERSDGHPHGRTPPPRKTAPEHGYYDGRDDTARRHRQVLQAIPLGPTQRNGKAIYEYKAHEIQLRDGGTRHPDGSPWEIAEARLDEWLIHCGVQVSRCGCVRPHAAHEGRACTNIAAVMTVWGNAHVPLCGPCAKEEVRREMIKAAMERQGSKEPTGYTRGVLVLDWVPDDI